MKVDEKNKIKVIHFCNDISRKVVGTIYSREVRAMKNRYIFKDICLDEFKKDVDYLKNLKRIIK